MPDTADSLRTGRLETWQSTTWSEATRGMSQVDAVWADNLGLHIGVPLPTTAPQYCSHVWGWDSAGRYIRIKIDGAHYWASVLTLDAQNTPGGVDVRVEDDVALIDGTGESAGVICAPDTSRDRLGQAAQALTVVSPESGGLGFLALRSDR